MSIIDLPRHHPPDGTRRADSPSYIPVTRPAQPGLLPSADDHQHRAARIAALRRAIDSGTYSVTTADLAQSLLRSMRETAR